jgi:sulfur relay protein TusB/DsrH
MVAGKQHALEEPVEGCLHLVMTASREALTNCLGCCGSGDTIVLMNSAVTLVAGPLAMHPSATSTPVLCLAADVQAQGMQEVLAGFGAAVIDIHDLVRLVCRHRHCLTWK